MGIGTRSKSHQGECLGQEQSLRVTAADNRASEKGGTVKGATNANNNTSKTNNSASHGHNSNNAAISVVNPSVNDRRHGNKQTKAAESRVLNVENGSGVPGGGGGGAGSSVGAAGASSGSAGTDPSTSTNITTSTNTSSNTSMTWLTRTRGVKRPKREPSPPGSPAKKVAKEVKTATPEAKKRQWELWTVDEKSTFFQALNECGRDFFAIQNNFAQKYKKNGAPAMMIKNKEQVRHFYYRTWHKISKYIEMKDDIKKHALEVYGLIHYGEMRKRLGGMRADKNLHKLNEFIQEGSTLIKIRRKSFRIRTPYCNALKKINSVEDPVEDDDSACRVPERVTLELNPKNNSAWLHVQEMAQNPRLRMTLRSDQHLSTVMSFLQKKWKPPRLKLKESLNSFDEIQKQLVLYPHRSSKCYPVSLEAIETQPRPDLKLNNYHTNIKAHTEKMHPLSANNENSSDAALAESPKVDGGIKKEGLATSSVKEPETPLTVSRRDFADIGSDNAMFPDDLMNLQNNKLDKLFKTSSLLSSSSSSTSASSSEVTTGNESTNTQCNNSDPSTAEVQSSFRPLTITNSITNTTNTAAVNTTTATATSTVNSTSLPVAADVSAAEDLERVKSKLLEQSKKGWTLQEAEDLTVAQLFLIFGKEGLIRLEYDWSKTSDTKEELYDCYTIINRLRRLVHLATMEFTDYVKVKAPKSNEKPKSGKSNPGCEVCEACGKLLNQSDSNSKGNAKLVNKNVNKNSSLPQNNAKNGTLNKESCVNSENTSKCVPVKKETKTVEKKVTETERVDGVFRVPVIPGRGPLSQSLIPNEYINQFNRPRQRRKLQRSARKPVFLQRTLLPKENPRMMTLTLLPTVTPVTVQGSFLSLNNRSNTVITTRTLTTFANTYTTQVLTQPIASTLCVQNQNNSSPPVMVPGGGSTVPQPSTAIAAVSTTPSSTIVIPTTASSAITNTVNSVKSVVVIPSPSSSPTTPTPLSVAATNPFLFKISSIVTAPSSTMVTESSTTDTDMITLLNVDSNSTDAPPTTPSSTTSSKPVSSPPNMSTLFDLSLSDVPMQMLEGSDLKGPSTDSGLVTPPLHTEYRPVTSPYSSPFKFNSDNAWMLGEMADISLGSFLGDSPIKKSPSSDALHQNVAASTSGSMSGGSLTLNNLFNDWSRDSSTSRMDLDTTLQMIMNENSMDYVSKFAELAEKVAAADATIVNNAVSSSVRAAKNSAGNESNENTEEDDTVDYTNTDDCLLPLEDNFH